MVEFYQWRIEIDINPTSDPGIDGVVLKREAQFFLVESGHLLSSEQVIEIVLKQMKEQ